MGDFKNKNKKRKLFADRAIEWVVCGLNDY
jgi:hypothetical protein